jgi:hypothetical protein
VDLPVTDFASTLYSFVLVWEAIHMSNRAHIYKYIPYTTTLYIHLHTYMGNAMYILARWNNPGTYL